MPRTARAWCGDCRPDKSFEILERTQLWMHRLVAAFRGANCPWAAHVLGPSLWRILAAFSAGAADGVDRGQVQDVEPKALNVRQNGLAVLERAVASRDGRARARKQLVPASCHGSGPIDDYLQLAIVPSGVGAIRIL